ncbi:phosphopantothenoylcysteine decarboxylase [Salpingoeca rosetta]|uniref:Phosphopantothenoylcysteine decarboxylase n=1 Tax=Salpingoeca rosetta (strain ATCC 50818 / BSB-021) TaxID=946362 RepID=F2U074_SALR5|nr:phosphopantothenoylcysteine decarboxylase [Salpingoeca rosetta]EGD80802.1 phosphopantothenoylcysteine decarboxylase [Salpingoeca rosetta]|eukprot:XP_004997363.1 phosphopantothenoylcysteine decarboxylase [Salpingoeca rosetta]
MDESRDSVEQGGRQPLHVLVGCTGSVATIKVPELVEKLRASTTADGRAIEVKVVATHRALHFVVSQEVGGIVTDLDEWESWKRMGDSVLHIELRKWADIFVIAPLSANTLAKISNGLCDNLLTCVTRAWNFSKPMIVCPAMNTFMWQHPATAGQYRASFSRSPSTTPAIPCGYLPRLRPDRQGALAAVDTIVNVVLDCADDVKEPSNHDATL